ncbi:MAG: glycosyltransferase [Lachnospiraceae bacterium]|nr:glycosyltransferase [Lachnospiraceae bacterium]
MEKKEKISIVIPCYYSEKTIGIVVDKIHHTMTKRKEYDYEIILVNDGSKDRTWEIISEMAKKNHTVKAINLSQNFGQHSAMMAGYRKATGDIIAGMDDDGENDPEEIFLLLDKLNEGYDCVCAEYEMHDSAFRSIGTKVNNWMACYLLNKPKELTLTSYYVMRRFVADQVIKYEHSYPYIAGLLLQATKNWGTVKLVRKERISGSSGYSLRKLLSLWINGFTAFSVKPLRIATVLGILFSVIGFIMAFVVVVRKLLGEDILLGYSSLMACMCFIGGMLMLIMGMIGEYVGRIYISINNSPQYVIREEVDLEKEEV